MLKRLRKFMRRKEPESRPIAPYRYGYTLEMFRNSPTRVDSLRELLRTPLFQAVMSVLQHEIPLDSIEGVRGHRRCLRLIELMAENPEKQGEQIETTFGAELEESLTETTNQQD